MSILLAKNNKKSVIAVKNKNNLAARNQNNLDVDST